MEHHEYMQLPFDVIPLDIIDKYNLTNIAHNGRVYIIIWEGVYGFPQAGIIAHDRLKSTWRSTDINLLNSPQESGPINPDPYPSPSFLITL